MKYFVFLVLLIFSGMSVIAMSDQETLVQSNNQFAIDLYQQLATQEGNLFFSPYSILSAMAMTYAGARGNTATEMENVLYFNIPDLHQSFKKLQDHLNAIEAKGEVTLSTANAIWPEQSYPFFPEYMDLILKHYDSKIQALDYLNAAEKSRKIINSWVEEKTNEKIKDLLPKGILNPLTVMVLTNAIYFKGNWEVAFNKNKTMEHPFYLSDTDSILVPTMEITDRFHYGEGEDYQLIKLPYEGGDLSMVILLPKVQHGLAALEDKLDIAMLEKILKQTVKNKVNVFLPKFKLSQNFELKEVFIAMGIKDAFDQTKGDFSGMSPQGKELFISKVLHKVFIEINEEGTEAAAATAVIITRESARLTPPVFKADHPFLFMIMEEASQSILFMGRVTHPGK